MMERFVLYLVNILTKIYVVMNTHYFIALEEISHLSVSMETTIDMKRSAFGIPCYCIIL